jgi:very-short-patch-repair endonuclease
VQTGEGKLKRENHLKNLAKSLRKKATDAEKVLWYHLSSRNIEGAKFRRSQQIGNYIVDFVCFEKKLIIEVDGGQHNEPQNKAKDEERTRVLKKKHYTVLRYWDNDVLQNTDGVLENIRQALVEGSHPHLTSPVEGEE